MSWVQVSKVESNALEDFPFPSLPDAFGRPFPSLAKTAGLFAVQIYLLP